VNATRAPTAERFERSLWPSRASAIHRPELLENRWHTSQKRSDRWIALALEGRGERSNRSAVGARVALTVRDGDGGERTQVREVHAGSSYLSQNELAVHFGWPEGSSLSKIMIRWPDGQEQTLGDLAIGQRHRLVQGD
ncbi:MAG: ASPIC/UnbV domain-containing protein, partial [Planctomycetota bacterium]